MYHSRRERTISDLEAQIERLSQALHRWQETERQLQPLEQRLFQLTERGAEILNRLAETDERHTQAVGAVEARLSEWGSIESRLHQEALERIRAFEKTIEQEWLSLRDLQEEPLKQLREQAAALGETCVAAANLSLRGYERAEARLAALEEDIRGQLAQLSRDVHAALAEVRGHNGHPAQLSNAPAPFPLDSVMRIHEALREPGAATSTDLAAPVPMGATLAADVPAVPAAPLQLPEPSALSERVDSLERELRDELEERRDAAEAAARLRRTSRLSLAALVGGLIVVGVLGVRLQQQVNARLDEAAARAAAAEKQAETVAAAADREIASARAETNAARDAAAQAALVTQVLTAPDLLRFNLSGTGDASAAFAQVMWSRSRGIIVSASRLPAASAGSMYRVWLWSNDHPIKVGELAPDATGSATLVVENPADLPRPINGASVTLESTGSADTAPTGNVVLIRRMTSTP